jgi:hypothetical protein
MSVLSGTIDWRGVTANSLRMHIALDERVLIGIAYLYTHYTPYCTSLHLITPHCTPLHPTAPHCSSLHPTTPLTGDIPY